MKDLYATAVEEPEALHDRVIRHRATQPNSALLFLKQGRLQAMTTEVEVEAPALCFWPHQDRGSIRISAGSHAWMYELSDTIMLDAIGARSESVHLRMLIEKPFQAQLTDAHILSQIQALNTWFVSEINNSKNQSTMSMAAFLRLMLIGALRVYSPGSKDTKIEQTDLLRRFRHLVELHYRDHWQMAAYAGELGIVYDRLHRICKRETGRSPAELVHERLTAEAKARLENSGFPLKKIAEDLGFPDASRFSHFFKRRTDMSPGAYRAIVTRPDGEDIGALRRGFADWP